MFNSQKNVDIYKQLYLDECEMAYDKLYLSCLCDRILLPDFDQLITYRVLFLSFDIVSWFEKKRTDLHENSSYHSAYI